MTTDDAGRKTRLLQLQHPEGISLELSTRGATWLTCQVPVSGGGRRNVVLGCPTQAQQNAQRSYLGATIGRYANRIGQARYAHGGRQVNLTPNAGSRHQLHGGDQGFHAREWQVDGQGETWATLSLVSPDGDEGFPGELRVSVTYSLPDPLTLEIALHATTSVETPVCLTNHAYFNLDGDGQDARAHKLHIQAAQYLPVDAELIPVGPLAAVDDTSYDFRTGKTIAQDWLADRGQADSAGFDHAFLLDRACSGMEAPAARLQSRDGALSMALFTTLPAIQFYGGQHLAGVPSRHGVAYANCAGVALEPQFLPDSPNHPEWPQPPCWLQPGQDWEHRIRYVFSRP